MHFVKHKVGTFQNRPKMANVILPFLMSMLLGRTIDLTTYDIGGSVFDYADYVETPAPSLKSTYHVIQDDVFPYTFFGVPPDIVLRIKSDFLGSSSGPMGLDGLLKDTSEKQTSVVVGVTTIYRTVDRTLKKDAEPLHDWQEKIAKTRTHYAQSLFYGSWCTVLFRFHCDVPGDVQEVRKTMTDTLGVLGELNSKTIGLWNQAVKAINANSRIRGEIKVTSHVYSTVAIQKEITTPASLMDVLDSLPNATGPVGQPLFMNLLPLHDLDEQFPEVKENIELLTELEKLDEMYDDVKITKWHLMRWVLDSPAVFSDEEEELISTFLKRLNDCIRAITKVSSKTSLFKETDREDIDHAFKTYREGLDKGVESYNLAYRRMKEKIDGECEMSFLHKVRGLLRVYEHELITKTKVPAGLQECKNLCLTNDKCRAVGYADSITSLDLATGLYIKQTNQCWVYTRSTSTAVVYTPDGIYGDMFTFDRTCYF